MSKFFFYLLAVFCYTSSFAQPLKKPNIVLIIGDDIGWNDFSCYGNKIIVTPNIDGIATEGIRFTNTYLTASSCSPSRSSIISGRYPHNTGAAELHTALPSFIHTFPEDLKRAGYNTFHAGKWHMGDSAKKGFDVSIEDKVLNGAGGEEQWVNSLRTRDKNKPFFAWFAAYDGHRPWEENSHKISNDNFDDSLIPPYLIKDALTKKDLTAYYNEIKRFDFFIGEVKNELIKQGVYENTVIIILSDNGRPFPRDKTTLYDAGVRTPMIVSYPNTIKLKNGICNALVSTIDIAPTILQLAGLGNDKRFQGKSFFSLLQNPSQKFRKYIFAEHNWHDYIAYERMIRTEDYLYIKNYLPTTTLTGSADLNGSPAYQSLIHNFKQNKTTPTQSLIFNMPKSGEEFYLVKKDTLQLNNEINNNTYQRQIGKLKSVLKKGRSKTGDTQPDNLTKDWFDRESGVKLKLPEVRGEMPGISKQAYKNNNRGPF